MTENFDFTTKIVENIGLPALILIYVAIKEWELINGTVCRKNCSKMHKK